jgi:hypothetical protein
MADTNVIQPSFAAGELSPALYGRVDLAKYHVGAARMRNFFVDYRGGASTRPGTQYIGTALGAGRLIPFVFSSTIGQSYILVFTNLQLQFVSNPGGPVYPNSSNAGFIQLGGGPYTISTPYLLNELPQLKFSQSADVMYLTHPNHPRMVLKRFSDTNWTLTVPATGTGVVSPTGLTISITGLPAGSTDPQNTTYLYTVTTVIGGEESNFGQVTSVTGIDIAATQGSITLNWNPIANGSYYKVYKAIPSPGGVVPPIASDFGFVGFAYGPQFTDGNIVADFTRTPPLHKDPFPGGGAGGNLTGYTIVSPGSGFPNYPPALSIADPTGAGAYVLPIVSDNVLGNTSGIVGLRIVNDGELYSAPVVTIAGPGSGFSVTFTLGPNTQFPRCSAFFQQRLVYASTPGRPVTLWGSRPGFYDNFDTTNPVVDSDSYEFTIASQQVNAIEHMLSMPGGLVLFTTSGVMQLTGGSSTATNPLAVTPTSAVVVPQSYYGISAEVRPIAINYDILYVQAEGSIIRDLAYNFFVNIYTGTDISMLSSHLFYPKIIIDWAYQDVPFKVVWAVRNDGELLSLTYIKEQDLYGWARHDTNGGYFTAVATVHEGVTDGTYFLVQRGSNWYVERLCDRVYNNVLDSWCLDAALSYSGSPITVVTGLGHLNGLTVNALADGLPRGPFVVTGSAITLPVAASNIVVGLPIQAQLQTLYLDVGAGGDGTIQGKRKKIAAMSTRVKDTAGLKIGTTFSTLSPFRVGVSSTDPIQPAPPGLIVGDMRKIMDTDYSVVGQICIQQDDPLPATVLAVIPEVVVGDGR